MTDEFEVQPLLEQHWPEVRTIYAEGLATGQASFEVSVPDWEAWNAARLPVCRLVAISAGEVLGWAALSPVLTAPVGEGVAEVSIYVATAQRGRGIGRALLASLIDASEAEGIWTLQGSVFPENEATIRLHEKAGFRVVGRRERIGLHYGRWRDTLLLERRSPIII